MAFAGMSSCLSCYASGIIEVVKHASSERLFLYALRLLGARAYSEEALRQKLARRAQPEVVGAVLQRIKHLGYLDDYEYAEGYVRLHAGKWGTAKLRRALLQKGVAHEIVERVLAQQAIERDPLEEAVALLVRYPGQHRGEKPKAMRFLKNRGYSFSQALSAWERYLEQTRS